MKRIDVLKGIEQILVQKAYEAGHISHRADGDWQKQADGSWKPYKGQSARNPNKKDRYGFNLLPDEDKQSYLDRANGDSYQAQILYEKDIENSPMGGLDEEEDQYDEITEEDLKEDSTTNTEYGEIIKQDFESVPKSIKDKMFTIAQQYQSEWAEDSDEDVRSMAENDVEDISQMLWDNADEETRNSWIGSEDSPTTNNENVKMSSKQLTRHLLKNGDYDSAIKQINFEEDDDGIPFTYDNNFELIVDNVMSDMGMSDEEKKINRGMVSRAIMDRALQLRKPAENTEYGEITEEDLVETPEVNLYDADQVDLSGYANNVNIDGGVVDNDDLEDVANQILIDNNLEITDENMNKARNAMLGWLDANGYLDSDEDDVEKSAVRDMRSAPTTKNMGF